MKQQMKRLSCVLGAVVFAVVTTAAIGGKPKIDPAIDSAVKRVTPGIVQIRHQIHEHPELSNREFETSKLVAAHLRKLGLEVQTNVAHTGVVGILRGGKPGPTIAVRADMDALPVTEDTPFSFKSTEQAVFLGQTVGVAHACGHDIHTSVQLGVVSVLASMREDLPGVVKFLFQPAEEGAPRGEDGGAEMMLREGALDTPRPEVVFALHSTPDLEVGQVGYTVGPAFAAVDHFYIEVHGVQAHGSAPEKGIDPIVTASQLVEALQTIRSRNLPAREPSVVTVGVFQGGTRFNIIPATVHLEGTVRTYNTDVQDTIERRMREICAGITQAAGATFEMEYVRVTPPTINDPALARESAPSLEKAVGSSNVFVLDPVMGGEDFAFFANEIPGFYFRLGTRKHGGVSGGLHTPTFTADDGAVTVGAKAMSTVLVDYLRRHSR